MEINLSFKELKMRTSRRCFKPFKMLAPNDAIIRKLSREDKLVLMHLTRAAHAIDEIQLQLDDAHNVEFRRFLNQEIAKGNEQADLCMRLFDAQKGIISPDHEGNKIKLLRYMEEPLSKNFYPVDLGVEEFHDILNKMLDRGLELQVRGLLTQRSVVKRKDGILIGIDYVDEFPEFKDVANELGLALKYSDDEPFNEYLRLQIKALQVADPNLDALADKAWAELVDGKFEFTITRECYHDRLTESIFENKELKVRLDKLGIVAFPKDCLGARVGLINKKGTKLLTSLRKTIDVASELMPYKNEYGRRGGVDQKQNAVDVDLVALMGDVGAYRAGITVAENLPNTDKLSYSIGGNSRNVYHRQIRKGKKNAKLRKVKIAEQFLEYINQDAQHWAVILHENTHSLGPVANLGKHQAILEELKADMGMLAFLNEFMENKIFTKTQAMQIVCSDLSSLFPKAMPELSQAHGVERVMIANKMLEKGAISLNGENKLCFDFDKAIDTAKELLATVVRLQIDGDIAGAGKLIEKHFYWSTTHETMATLLKKHNKTLNAYVRADLAVRMLQKDFESTLGA